MSKIHEIVYQIESTIDGHSPDHRRHALASAFWRSIMRISDPSNSILDIESIQLEDGGRNIKITARVEPGQA